MAELALDRKTYRDRVEGGWLGRNAGNTLGAPVAGRMEAHGLTFYDPTPGQCAASEEMDLQLAALEALRSVGPGLTGADLAEVWANHVRYVCDELGYARRNLRRGLRPPISGKFDNWFRSSSSAANRSLLWAMVAPGAPQVAAAFAFEDARIDHSEEGVWAAMFWAAVQSAAFFVSDRARLLEIGLRMTPAGCRVARAVQAARDAHVARLGWLEARTSVLRAVGHPNYSDAAQNTGFGVIGLLYGGGEFGASVSAAVNCGYDSDGVGAIVGGVLGILSGRSGLPARWLEPIGEGVVLGWGLVDLAVPGTVSELSERTVAEGERVLAARCPGVALVDVLPAAASAPSVEPKGGGVAALAALLAASDAAAPPAVQEPTEQEGTAPALEPVSQATPEPAPSSAAPEAAGVQEPAAPEAAPEAPAAAPDGRALVDAAEPSVAPAPDAGLQATSGDRSQDVLETGYDWMANADVRRLLALPATTSTHHVDQFEIVVDYGEGGPAIVPNVATSLVVTVRNRAASAFVGMVQLSAPKGWEVRVPGAQGQRQMLAAGGMARFGFVVRASEAVPIAAKNTLTLVLSSEAGRTTSVDFTLLGSAGWYVVGPFKNNLEDGFERAFGPEDQPGLENTYLGRSGGLVRWTRMAFKETVMDVESLFDGQPGVLYGRTLLHVPTPTDCRLVLHTNDGGRVWLNGRLVLQRHWHAPFRPTPGEGPCMADAALKAGDNELLLKVVRCHEPAELALMVTDRKGEPLEDCLGMWA